MEINRDAVMIRMAELQISRRQLAERAGMSYGVLCEALTRGDASPITVGKLAQGLCIEVEKIAKAKEVPR